MNNIESKLINASYSRLHLGNNFDIQSVSPNVALSPFFDDLFMHFDSLKGTFYTALIFLSFSIPFLVFTQLSFFSHFAYPTLNYDTLFFNLTSYPLILSLPPWHSDTVLKSTLGDRFTSSSTFLFSLFSLPDYVISYLALSLILLH